MFFPERIISIKQNDRVLEIGPGGSPHPRANVLLEKVFDDPKLAEGQRGYTPELKTDKEVIFYKGEKFPFDDKEFDYVICSHVLEHIDDVNIFISEISRVGKAGYLEYPLIYYDFIYNFPEHITFIKRQHDLIVWMPKDESALSKFKAVNAFFYESFKSGYTSLVDELKDCLFEGFEWFGEIKSKRTKNIDELVFVKIQFPAKRNKKSNLFQKIKESIML